ncbi:DUF6124 family protein [Pseudomonas sp. HLT2-19-2]
MHKVTPNPPDIDSAAASESIDPEKLNQTPRKPSTIFFIAPEIDNQTLLEYACESLASANVMVSDFARYLKGCKRPAKSHPNFSINDDGCPPNLKRTQWLLICNRPQNTP